MHVRFIVKNQTNPAYDGAIVGATKVARQHQSTIDHVAPLQPDNIQEQKALVDAALASKPDAIVLLPAHASQLTDAINRINDAGVPLFLIVSEAAAGHWLSYIGTDSKRMAYDLGIHTLSSLPPDAKIVIMDGHPDAITTGERHQGYRDALANFPAMTLLDCVCGNYQYEPAYRAAINVLDKHPEIDAILVANDLMGMGVIRALKERMRKARVSSINGTPDAVSAILEGDLFATASFNTHDFGCLAMEAAIRHLKGEIVPKRIMLPADLIDFTNAKQWNISYEARRCPQWTS